MRAACRLLVLALSLTLVGLAPAQTTFVWTGQGADSNILTAQNWEGNVAPSGNPADNLLFPVTSVTSFLQLYPTLTAPLTVDDITFNFPSGAYFLTGSAALTLGGDLIAYSYSGISAPIILAAGNHVIDTYVNGDADAYGALSLSGNISGAGGITKTGDGQLTIAGGSNTYSGDTVVSDGWLVVGGNHPLGFGTVTLNGGSLQASPAGTWVSNDLVLGSSVTFWSDLDDGAFNLGNGDGSSIRPVDGLTTVSLNLIGGSPLYVYGDLEDGNSGPTKYSFYGSSGEFSGYHLGAYNTYTGGTVVNSGATVIFDASYAVPESGAIRVDSGAYAGLATTGLSPASFISRIDALNSYGTVGFDDGITVSDDVDLSGLNYGVTLGTRSSATLSGLITPAGGGDYSFLSSGRLYLTGEYELSGNRGLVSQMLYFGSYPGMVVLSQSVPNTYSLGTSANGGAVVFDQPGTLPDSGGIALSNGGYISFTETSGLILDDLTTRISSQFGTPGVLGIDTHDAIFFYAPTPTTYANDIDLGTLSSPVYLGTASHMTVTGSIDTTDDDTDDYYFTGYGGGQLTIDSLLTGSKAVHIGLANDNNSYSSVTLGNDTNDFTSGIVFNSGVLFAANPAALGTGPITVDAQNNAYTVTLVTQGDVANDITLESGSILDVSPYDSPLTLSGTISGYGSLAVRSQDFANVTISGDNSYENQSLFGSRAVVTAASDTALGMSSLTLTEGATVHFTTATPQIGALIEGSAYVYDEDGYYQQDAALIVGGGGPTSTLTINQGDWGYFEGSILEDDTTLSVVINGGGHLEIGGGNYDGNNPYPVYSGGTTINDGVLVAGSSNALGAGAITLNGTYASLQTSPGVTLTNVINFGPNGGILRGNGTFTTPITAGANVVLAPGSSPGTMTFAAGLTLAPGGSLNAEVQYASGAAGTGYDLVSISGGALDITANSGTPFTIYLTSLNLFSGPGDVSDFSSGSNYSWMLFEGNAGGGINNFNATSFALDLSGFSNSLDNGVFSLAQGLNGGNPAIFLNFTAVPEPSTYALLALGLGGVLFARRRRRS